MNNSEHKGGDITVKEVPDLRGVRRGVCKTWNAPCTIGIDYGTNQVRALVVDATNGGELGSGVVDYPSGKHGVLLDGARPSPRPSAPRRLSLRAGTLRETRRPGAGRRAGQTRTFSADADVIGIGVDSTGSSPLPVDEHNVPLALHRSVGEDHLAAQCWLWKDHTGHREAARITALAAEHRPQYIAKCGNTYSVPSGSGAKSGAA